MKNCGTVGVNTYNGIIAHSLYESVIAGNVSLGNSGSGIGLNNDQTDQKSKNVVVANNILTDNQYDGIDINNGNTTQFTSLTLIGNQILRNHKTGIYVYKNDDVQIVGNYLSNNYLEGIHMNESSYGLISSNFCRGNSGASPGSNSGIFLNGSWFTTITGNTSTDNGEGMKKQKYGMEEVGTANKNVFANNVVWNNWFPTIPYAGGNTIFSGNQPADALLSGSGRAAADRTFFGALLSNGYGSPNGMVSAPVGSVYMRIDGTPGGTLWIKETNPPDPTQGWVGK